jgi:Concanavalin A-like lectin/glucanases superfamily
MSSTSDHFDQLLSRYFEGVIAPDELAELEAKLLADEGFAEHVARWCVMHRQIAELRTEHALHQLMDQFITGSSALPKDIFELLHVSSDRFHDQARRSESAPNATSRRGGRTTFATWLPVSAIVLGILLLAGLEVAMWSFGRGKTDEPGIASTPSDAAPPAQRGVEIAATLTQLVDGVWQPGAPVLEFGKQLSDGTRIALQTGMAKVTFECGAEVVLQGPCDFTVQNNMAGYLHAGRITAHVPRRAFSFAIHSREVDFVDTGTAFGVSVGNDGQTELHVFEGEVLCGPSKDKLHERKDIIHVMANKALEFRSQQRDPTNIVMDARPFSRLIDLRHADKEPSTRVVPKGLALWLSADTAVKTDPESRVIAWQDIIYGDNRSGEDALQSDEQARPTLVEDAINGRPAVRFNGTSDYLLTTPLETTNNQTVLFVCQFSPAALDSNRRWGGQIINYDGPPSRYLSDTLEPGVLQIGEPLLEEQFKPTLITGQVFAGFIGAATVESGRVDAEQVGAGVPIVVSYVYDFDHGRAVLSINGHPYGESRAFAPQGITSRKIIGRHAWKQLFFCGDLAEMMIYNKALSPQELTKATTYLTDKYSIQFDGPAGADREAAE